MNTDTPRCIDEFDLRNRNVVISVDFNVPPVKREANYKIKDPSRIVAALPTIRYAIQEGARGIL